MDRFKQLQPVLAKKGIEMDYTEKLEDLNPGKLAGYEYPQASRQAAAEYFESLVRD